VNIFNLFASLKLDTTDYDKGIDKAKTEGNDFANTTENKISPKAIAAFASVATAVIAVTKAIGDLAKKTLDYADNVGDMAAKFGVTTDSISEMQYIADQSSTSVEGLTSAMTMLLNRAKEDGEVFQRLGVSVQDANGNFKAMDELFYDTVGALNEVEDANERNVLMLETFGRSAMSVGEVVRKSSEELEQMRREAHELGVVMSEETINSASDFNDALAVLKLQGQSALAGLVAGAPDAEERFQEFIDNLLGKLEQYVPSFVRFGVKLILQVAVAILKVAPSLSYEIVGAVLDVLLDFNMWMQVGVDIIKAVFEGAINVIPSLLNALLGRFGVNIPKFRLGTPETALDPIEVGGGQYEVKQSTKSSISVNIEASGDTPVSQETAEKTAQALAPYLDQILGGK
jgi:hypothetical protein